MTMIYQIPDNQRPADVWDKAFVIDKRIAQLYANPVEKLIQARGGHLYSADGLPERSAVRAIVTNVRV